MQEQKQQSGSLISRSIAGGGGKGKGNAAVQAFQPPAQFRSAGQVVQRAAQESKYGVFLDELYDLKDAKDSVGVDMLLSFRPLKRNIKGDATKIGLVQSVKSTKNKQPAYVQLGQKDRTAEDGAGFRIDRLNGENNPVYGSPRLGDDPEVTDTPRSTAPGGAKPAAEPGPNQNTSYVLGSKTDEKVEKAKLHDAPRLNKPAIHAGQEFETTALVLEGDEDLEGTYLGSVKWGWSSNGVGTAAKMDFELASDGDPTANFQNAAEKWNEIAGDALGDEIEQESESEEESDDDEPPPMPVFKTKRDIVTRFYDMDILIHKGATLRKTKVAVGGSYLYQLLSPTFTFESDGLIGAVPLANLKEKQAGKKTKTVNAGKLLLYKGDDAHEFRLGNNALLELNSIVDPEDNDDENEEQLALVTISEGRITNNKEEILMIYLSSRDVVGSAELPIPLLDIDAI